MIVMLQIPTTLDGLQYSSAIDHTTAGLNVVTLPQPSSPQKIISAGCSAYTRDSSLNPSQVLPGLTSLDSDGVTFSCVIPDDGLVYLFSYYVVVANCS